MHHASARSREVDLCPAGITTDELERIAVATLGFPVSDSAVFRRNCRTLGLGQALNIEHDLLP